MARPKISNSFVGKMQRWMDSVPGQTFLNYAYSWGASVVILGTLFKLTHLPGANIMLFIGMGTEVVVFFLSAFDRPFDKTSSNRELSEDFVDEVPVPETDTVESEHEAEEPQGEAAGQSTVVVGGGQGTVIIAGGQGSQGSAQPQEGADGQAASQGPLQSLQTSAQEGSITAQSLIEVIRLANEELLRQAEQAINPEMEEASRQYIEKLQALTETLDRIESQSTRLTADSEEMTNLNRTLTGINTVYELQLKSVSKQIGSIERINEQTRHMADQIEELNSVYARMIKALTVNMRNAGAPGAADPRD